MAFVFAPVLNFVALARTYPVGLGRPAERRRFLFSRLPPPSGNRDA